MATATGVRAPSVVAPDATSVAVIAVITSLYVGAVVWVYPSLPASVGTSFDIDGAPREVHPTAWVVGLMLAAMAIVPALAIGRMLLARDGAHPGGRGVLTLPPIQAFLAGLSLSILGAQRGLADGWAARLPVAAVLLPVLAAAGLGLVLWRVVPEPPPVADVFGGAPGRVPLTLAAGERVVWTRSTPMTGWLRALLAAGVVVMLLVGLRGTPGLLWGSLAGTLVAVLVWSVRVTVDPRGVCVQALPGLPRYRIPYASIERVEAITCEPIDYGGWGLRVGPAGVGVILRGGSALRVVRRKGPAFVVTVDDAQTGAALADAYLSQGAHSR